MIFPWKPSFSYGFPRVFLWFSHENLHFPMVFLGFSYGFPMKTSIFLWFAAVSPQTGTLKNQELPEWIAVGLINLWVLSQSTVVILRFFVDIIRQSSSSLLLKALESFLKSIFFKNCMMLRWILRSFSYWLLRIPIFDCSQFQFFVLQIYMGLSENRVYSQWNSHLIGIMIINHWL